MADRHHSMQLHQVQLSDTDTGNNINTINTINTIDHLLHQVKVLIVHLTDIPGGGAHHRLQLELSLELGGGGQVEDPVVVDESHQ